MTDRFERGKRVVITGMGVVCALGLDTAEVWEGVLQGRSGVGMVTWFDVSQYPTQIAGFVKDFDPALYMNPREARRMDRFSQFAVAAASQAMRQAGLDLAQEDPTRVGVEIGSAIGGIGVVEEQSVILKEKGVRRVNATAVPMFLTSMAACQVGIQFGLKGPTASPVAACATGVVAVGEAMWRLRLGQADVILAGGAESADTPLVLAAFSRMGALSTRNDSPKRACRPFDADRDGTVMGEGSVVFVLETLEHARARHAHILAEVVGYGLTGDAFHIAAPDPEGDGATRSMRAALQSAGLQPADIHYIAAHGTGTPLNDASETVAIKKAFGEWAYKIPISSNKPVVGHMLGAAGAFSTLVLVHALRDNLVPPTINLERPDPACDLDYVPGDARQVHVDRCMANAFGFGGQNASLILARFKE